MLSGDNSGDEETPVSKVSRTVVMTTQSPLGASAAGGEMVLCACHSCFFIAMQCCPSLCR